MRLLIAFIAVPLIEIGLFIQVGDAIGLWPTLLIVLLTAIVGTALVRSQGTQVVHALQGSFQAMQDPTMLQGSSSNISVNYKGRGSNVGLKVDFWKSDPNFACIPEVGSQYVLHATRVEFQYICKLQR